MRWDDPLFSLLFWPLVTVGLYAVARLINRRWPRWWTSPIVLTPPAVIGLVFLLKADYRQYMSGTHWLLAYKYNTSKHS